MLALEGQSWPTMVSITDEVLLGTLSVPSKPGFRGLTITKKDIVYPETQTLPVITLQYAVRDETKRLHAEDLETTVTVTVYSGNMKPRKTSVTIAELATVP